MNKPKRHHFSFDIPWHMVRLRDWFFMCNWAAWNGVLFTHVRVLGFRVRFEIPFEDIRRNQEYDLGIDIPFI